MDEEKAIEFSYSYVDNPISTPAIGFTGNFSVTQANTTFFDSSKKNSPKKNFIKTGTTTIK
jgi:hypothetical protein